AQPAAHPLQHPGRVPRPRTPAGPPARTARAGRTRSASHGESRMRPSIPFLAISLALGALAGCAITDTPAPTPTEPPAAFRHAPELPVVASDDLRLPPADAWWQSFADPDLDAL